MEHAPHVGAAELEEIGNVLQALPPLRFPINSGGELLDQLGEQEIVIVGVEVDAARMLKYMPASYFPLASLENFVEKMAELIRDNRTVVDIDEELTNLRQQLPELRFPIRAREELLEQVGDKAYSFRGGDVRPKDIVHRVPERLFPIESREDFEAKIGHLIATRPLIVGE